MSTLAILAVVLGCIPILAGAAYLCLDDPRLFCAAFGISITVMAGIAAATWGVTYLLGYWS